MLTASDEYIRVVKGKFFAPVRSTGLSLNKPDIFLDSCFVIWINVSVYRLKCMLVFYLSNEINVQIVEIYNGSF